MQDAAANGLAVGPPVHTWQSAAAAANGLAVGPPVHSWQSAASWGPPVEVLKTANLRCKNHAALSIRFTIKTIGLGMMGVVFLMAFFYYPHWVVDDDATHRKILTALFCAGLTLVALEDVIVLNKSAVMLILAATMWTYRAVAFHPTSSEEGHEKLALELEHGLADVGSIVLFLLPAMGLVESIDHFNGFAIVTRTIVRSMGARPDLLMPIICFLSFFLSSIIDNLTATIVAVKLLRHLVPHDKEWRHSCGGLVVIAANAGGAWSPIGDVTTTMLWIQNKITVTNTVTWLFVPSFVAGVLPLFGIWWQATKCSNRSREENADTVATAKADLQEHPVSCTGLVALVFGILVILMVPVLKVVTGLPPYLGMLLALGVFWVVTDCFHFEQQIFGDGGDSEAPAEPAGHQKSGVALALHQVDLTSLLFFTGVLLAVVTLDDAGVLKSYASWLVEVTGDSDVALTSLLGVSSAVVDNVPLVQAAIEMFDKPVDSPLWQLVALAAGTGGSILSVGSVAGVTLMGMEGVGFLWYLKRISLWAAVGFAAGIATYQLEMSIFGVPEVI